MRLGERVDNFSPPPHPKGIVLLGETVRLEPLSAEKHAQALFAANALDEEGGNWTYLPYGPFDDLQSYQRWVHEQASKEDPAFFAIIKLSDGKAAGVASYLRINQADGSIEVGHIHYSPALQRTKEGTEAMYLMMQWAFEQGYRRYEWKCNALNLRSRQAAQRLGFSYEGTFRQTRIDKGRSRDTAWFAAIDKEWSALKDCYKRYLLPDNVSVDGRAIVSLSSLTKPLLYKLDDLGVS